jgi:Vitamin K epoxide reductase family
MEVSSDKGESRRQPGGQRGIDEMTLAQKLDWLENGPSPQGWNVNPSAWPERLGVLGLAITGLGIAVYLGLFQIDVLGTVWDPYFRKGSQTVLLGSMQVLPIPDAFLGAFVYLLDFVFGAIGGNARWRTHPWAILIQGVITLALGVAGVVLTICQKVVFGAYCTLCLASAACSVSMVGFVAAEVLATLQHLKRIRCQGGSLRQAFWGHARGATRATAASAQ